MATVDSRRSVLDIVNEVRKLTGLNTVSRLDADKHSLVALRMLNNVVAEISNYGDWHELIATTTVLCSSSVNTYSLGINSVVKNIWEVAVSGQRQSLYPTELADILRFERGGGVGVPRRWTIQGVDTKGNPKIKVHPQPGANENGQAMWIVYFLKPQLYDTTSADVQVVFPANVVIQGLYAAVLTEEAGGLFTKESLDAKESYLTLLKEELNRYNADSGAGSQIQIIPSWTGRR